MEFTERNSHYAMTQGAIKTLPQKLCNLCAIASLRWIFTIMPHQPTKDESPSKNITETTHRKYRMEFTEQNSHYAMTHSAIKTFRKNFATFAPLRLCVGSLQS